MNICIHICSCIYDTDKFLSCDDLVVAVMGDAWCWNVISSNMNLVMQNLEKQTDTNERYHYSVLISAS